MSSPVTKNSEIQWDGTVGLSSADAEKRLQDFGLNRVAKQREISFFGIAKQEVVEPMILLLLVVGVIYTVWGKLEDAITIFAVIAALVFAEVWNEYRAKKAIASLSKLASPKTKLIRDGRLTEVETEKVVPGDVLILAQGTRIAADGKLIESFGTIQVDESPLTGESLPVEKKKNDPIYAGTLVVSGDGKSVALATGKDTKIGKISTQIQEIKPPKTPLQLAMKSLAKKLVWVALFFSIGIPLFGFAFRGLGLREMVLTGLALAFATIPEELPIIITMNLGLGAYKLSKENFLVKKLKAAEVLGNATVILTDKTGTITENTMSVAHVFPENLEQDILVAARGATTEISLSYTDKAIFERSEELKVDTRGFGRLLRERNFGDSGRKTRSIVREVGGKPELFVIGAPEEMFNLCKVGEDSSFAKALETETSKGRRVIAVARRKLRISEQDQPFDRIELGLKLLGLISIEDPPRKGVKETVESAMKAGVRTVMVTGDHPQTAVSIAKSVGITYNKVMTGEELDRLSDAELREAVKEVSVFARTTPQHKYRLMEALRKNGEVVAVTGDGVNDALALKGADIGIAMGIKGTDVAKEAADIVLADDNYVTIGRGIFEGRRIFENLWKGVKYYLSVKTALVAIFLASLIGNVAFPFPPIQIIVLELFMDLAASSGFVAEPPENVIYERPSGLRKSKGESTATTFLDSSTIKEIAIRGLCLSIAVLVSYAYALEKGMPLPRAQTFAFSAWIIGHIMLAMVSRSEKEPLFKIGIFSNKAVLIWAGAAFAFLLVTLVIVPASGVTLKLVPIGIDQLGLIFGICFVSIFWLELRKMLVPFWKKAV